MIKAFFAPENQMARLQADVPASSIFVHLHGILYTQTNLDSFDTGLARLEEKLEETFVYAKAQAARPPRRSIRGKERDDPSQRLNRDSTWIMMAVSNIAAMMEYGRENGLLKAALVKAQDQKKSEKQSNRAEKKNNPHGDPTPSEASLHDLAKQVERLGLEISKQKSATRNTSADLPPIPVTLQLAMRLTFSLLRVVFRHPMKPDEIDPAICPYITTMLTFLATLAHNAIAFAIIRSEVPWEALRGFLDTLPKFALDAYLRKDSNVPNRLLGITLPEDWCIRGLEWTGKQLFGRGYWKGKLGTAYMSVSQSEAIGSSPSGEAHGYSMPDSEKDVLAERYEGPSMPPHAGGPQRTAIEDAQLDEDGEEPSDRETVARLRWKRVALCAAWLARAVPFIALEDGKITFDKALFDTVTEQDSARYDASHEEAAQGEGASIVDKPSPAQAVAETDELDSDDYLLGSGDESETVKELKARRRELKALLQESRESRNFKQQQALTSSGTGSDYQQQRRAARSTINALAGYTTLVFDTNVLLEAIEMFTALLTTKKWTLVVPLAVVTELDGLRTKEDSLGTSATQAINFLEDAVKSYSMNLKVQTSKGNYLRDLNIRREDIDFGHNANYGQRGNNGSDGSVKSMDDVILNVAMWQKTHWLDRRALLGIKANAKAEKENAVSSGSPVKTVLVSSDRTLRLKGKARGLEVCDAVTLQQLVEQPPNG